MKGIHREPDHAACAAQVDALAACAPRSWPAEALGCLLQYRVVFQKNPPLRAVDHHFVAIQKPLTAAIRVAIDAHHTAVARRPKDLDHRPRPADELETEWPPTLSNMYAICAVDCSRRSLQCSLIHCFPFVLSNNLSHHSGCFSGILASAWALA
jgi:hypothetical protein